MFYFQQLFNTAMGGIDSGGATAGAVQVAQYILLASLLFGIYESWARGGDTHFLGATAVRYFAVGLVMINYSAAFRDVNGMFNNVASFINTSTAGAMCSASGCPICRTTGTTITAFRPCGASLRGPFRECSNLSCF
jgi:hypothetical protein